MLKRGSREMTCPKHRGRITRERDATLERFSIKEKKMANDNHLKVMKINETWVDLSAQSHENYF